MSIYSLFIQIRPILLKKERALKYFSLKKQPLRTGGC